MPETAASPERSPPTRLHRLFLSGALACLAGCALPWRAPAPPDTALMRTEADAAYAARDWALAAARLRALADLNPQDAGLRFRLGNALVRAGRLEEAIAAYSDSLRLEPAQPKAQHNRGVAHLRLASASLGQAAALTSEPDIAERAAAMVRAVDALLEPDAP